MYDPYDHGESIYNIIPPKEIEVEKPPMHRSKHNPKMPPTATTFGGAQTSHPVCMNIAGDYNDAIVPTKSGRNFGKPPGTYKNNPNDYMKKNAKTTKVSTLKEVKQTQPNLLQPTELKPKLKPDVPKKQDMPVMNLVTSKNFVVANAVETILAAPKKVTQGAKEYLSKEDYGKVPKYLQHIKKDIEAEYDYIRQLEEQEREAQNSQVRPLGEDERNSLIAGLKAKWESVNTEYQATTHLTKLDTHGKIMRKEKYEAQLMQIEKDIEKLNRKNILITRDN
jgi:hypothetical protein|mmetsp:Transcript_94373/g.149246  ORF Transcript_94373/g.149246 Transcript_94373/m.149246 type:complete len:279 (-) Transcript_94373:105-941(-)